MVGRFFRRLSDGGNESLNEEPSGLTDGSKVCAENRRTVKRGAST